MVTASLRGVHGAASGAEHASSLGPIAVVILAVAVAAVAVFGCARAAKKPRRSSNNVYYYGQGCPPPPAAGYAYPQSRCGGPASGAVGLAVGAAAGLPTAVVVDSAVEGGGCEAGECGGGVCRGCGCGACGAGD
ncbi:hypothetical protein ACP70R_021141 [Stipagrostis hirtigluma subsp. patula]